LCDINIQRAIQIAQRFEVSSSYCSLEECSEVDAVLVATPVGTRRKILTTINGRGWHSFCEKPFADRTEAHEFMLNGAERSSLVVACGYMRRYYWATRVASEFIKSWAEGETLRAVASDCQRLKRSPHGGNWYLSNAALSGGGFLMETGSHLIDQLFSIVGAIDVKIERFSQKRVNTVDFETVAIGSMRDVSGRTIPFEFALSRFRDFWSGITVKAGTRSVELNLRPDSPIVLNNSAGPTCCTFPAPRIAMTALVEAYTAQFLEFLKRIEHNDVASNETATGLLTTRFLSECYQQNGGSGEICSLERAF
jgi:predicted dehydrogenase